MMVVDTSLLYALVKKWNTEASDIQRTEVDTENKRAIYEREIQVEVLQRYAKQLTKVIGLFSRREESQETISENKGKR